MTCCNRCRTPWGVCADRSNCYCHALEVEESLRGTLPYRDPVGNTAVNNINRQRAWNKRNRQNR